MRYQRFFTILFAAMLICSGSTALAMEKPEDINPYEPLPDAVEVISIDKNSVPAKSAILMSQESGQVLFEKDADILHPPASITKVMTMLLVVEAIDGGRLYLDDMVTITDHASSMGGSQIWLEPNEQMTVGDLFKAVAISSANDASCALAEHLAGSEETFVEMMNRRANELGMENTSFVNCSGLDAEGHFSTARDISIMSRELLKHPVVGEYSTVWMDSLRDGETQLINTNKLVRFYEGCTGLKTGTTDGAGSCLSASAVRDGLGLVAVVMGCTTSDDRFASARGLLDYGFANYTLVSPPPVDNQLTPVKVLRGVEESVALMYDSPGQFLIDRNEEENIRQEVAIAEDVQAPVEEGQSLGRVKVYIGDEIVSQYDLKAAESVAKMNFSRAFARMLGAAVKLNETPKQ